MVLAHGSSSNSKHVFGQSTDRGIMSANEPDGTNKALFSSCKFGSAFDEGHRVQPGDPAAQIHQR